MLRVLRLLRRAFWRTFEHDGFAVAKAAAYSAVLTLFPALLVVASALAASSITDQYLLEISYAVGRILPAGSGTAMAYFQAANARPIRALIPTSLLTVWTASGIMISLMEGFRNAYQLPKTWGIVKQRFIAFYLVFLTLLPMTFATLLVAFGNQIESWMVLHSGKVLGPVILMSWTLLRWVIALATSVAVLQLLYHWGVPRRQPWHNVLPGAVAATVLWFTATAAFGWYVRHYRSYSVIYGSLATAIVLLVWMYIVSVIVLVGQEFNALVYPKKAAPAKVAQKEAVQVP